MNIKKLFYYLCALLVLTSASSCVQDEIFENESDEQLELMDYRYVCVDKKCRPIFYISSVGRVANVYLSCTDHDHKFTFKCWDKNGFAYKEEQFLPANTSFSISFPPVSTNAYYDVSYDLSCRTCYGCSISGTIRVNSDGTIGTGSTNTCFKNYLSYTAKLDYQNSNRVIIETQSFNNFHDTEHYMDVNKVRVYTIDTYGNKTQYSYPKIESLSPYELRISNLPTTSNIYSMKSGRVELYNDKCKGNFEHYMFFTYTGNGDIRFEQYALQEHKEH